MTAIDEITAVHSDWRPGAEDDRAAIRAAVQAAADEHGGLVHAADVRRHLRRDVNPAAIGAVICALVRQGVLVNTEAVRDNGGRKSRNATKPARVRLLIGDLA